MSRFIRAAFVFIVSLGVVSAASALAQTNTGRITGTVTDPTGAVIPGVEITVRNPATGLSRNTVSNESGNYQVPLLPPAVYEVQAALAGFATEVRAGITVQVDAIVRVDYALKVGNTAEKIEVTADAPLLQNETASLGQVIDARKVTDIPLNQRHFMSLTLLTNGVLPDVQGGSNQSPSFYANGVDRAKNNFLFDGVDNNDPGNNQLNIVPSVDAIEEFKISTNAYGAELGRASGGVVNVQTKSGTNDFHAVLFEFLRNDKLDARNPFATKNQPFKRNQFGVVASGPIKKDRIFFLFNYEGNRIRQTDTSLTHVPSLKELAGDFSETPKQLIDPLTGQPFAGNIIPPNRINTIAQNIATFYPKPNMPLTGGANYESNAKSITDTDLYTGRVDVKISDKQTLFGRITWQDTYQIQSNFSSQNGGSANLPRQGNTFFQPYGRNVALSDTYIFGPRAVNEARIGFNRLDGGIFDETYRTDYAKQLGVTGVQSSFFPNPLRFGWPRASATGYSSIGTTSFSAQQRYDNTWHLYDMLALTRGNHQMKIGGEVRTYWLNIFIDTTPNGSFTFDGHYSGLGNGFADMLLGYPIQTTRTVGNSYDHNRSRAVSAFFQDDWKASPQLTLNLGLRWEMQTRPINVLNDVGRNLAVFDPKTGQILITGRSGPQNFINPVTGQTITLQGANDFGYPDGLYFNDYKDFGPRVGFAYSPKFSRMVVRGGYGIFLEPEIAAKSHSYRDSSYPWNIPQTFVAASAVPNITMYDPFPAAFGNSGTITAIAADPHQRDGYVQQWNLTTQVPTGENMSFEVAYVGTKGTHINSNRPINQPQPGPGSVATRRPFPNFGAITQNERAGVTVYHSMQAKFERRFSGGATFISAYTLSHAIACCAGVTGLGGSFGAPAQNPLNLRADRAQTSYDVRQRQVNSFSYELPFGPNKHFLGGTTGPISKVVGGWQVAGIATFTTGQHFTPVVSGDITGIGVSTTRPNRIGDGNLPRSQRTADKWFDTSAFVKPDSGTYGNAGQNELTGPGLVNWDLTFTKVTRIAESKRVEFRGELFNAFNQTHFTIPVAVVNNLQFGHVTSANPARQIQFGLKFYY